MVRFSDRLLFILAHIVVTTAQPRFTGYRCTGYGNYTLDSSYQANLNTVISILTSNTNNSYGFYNFSAGQNPDTVNTIALCRGDVDLENCRSCIADSTSKLRQVCPNQKEAYGWYDSCMFRYSGRPIYHIWDTSVAGYFQITSNTNASQPNQFKLAWGLLLDKVRGEAVKGDSHRKFATGTTPGPDNSTIYALAQCTPDLTKLQCNNCLANIVSEFPTCCDGATGAVIFEASCVFRYDTFLFYSDTPASASAPPPHTTPTMSPPLQPPTQMASPPSPQGKSDKRTKIVLFIVIPTMVFMTLGCICIFIRKRKQSKAEAKVDEIQMNMESFQYDLEDIKSATDNFSEDNKLAQGGFAAVYKGRLKNGKDIAVKKLRRDSTEAERDFKNEVSLLAKLQHKNLVSLYGFCLDGTKILLIYELVPNATLHDFLYAKHAAYSWNTCYKIIEGVARGLIYLHVDSRHKIIHRDLKPSNILLDEDLSPKIADFGTARLFPPNETHASTNQLAGTFGYMAPEYVTLGQYSESSDVFSFGVIVLQIVSGQRMYQSRSADDFFDNLLSYAWKTWQDGAAPDLIDPMLRIDLDSLDSIMRCIHIGLLCVQKNVIDRPSIVSVGQWLCTPTIVLPKPKQPAYFMSSQESTSTNWGV